MSRVIVCELSQATVLLQRPSSFNHKIVLGKLEFIKRTNKFKKEWVAFIFLYKKDVLYITVKERNKAVHNNRTIMKIQNKCKIT